jgi:hypothetical protein
VKPKSPWRQELTTDSHAASYLREQALSKNGSARQGPYGGSRGRVLNMPALTSLGSERSFDAGERRGTGGWHLRGAADGVRQRQVQHPTARQGVVQGIHVRHCRPLHRSDGNEASHHTETAAH